MIKKMYAVSMLAASLTAGAAIAAEPVAMMDEVVVSATKTEETIRNVVNSVIVLDEFDIEESPAKSFGELLANEAGVDWRTYGNYGGASSTLQLRGMDGDETQVLINGVPLNSPSLGSANVSKVPLNSIERVEVVKGSGSVLYGSGAMAGTVNIITKSPQREQPVFKAFSGYGTDETYEMALEQGMFVFGDLGYYLTATQRGTDGERENSRLNHKDLSGKLLLDKGKLLKTSLFAQYIDRDYGVPGINPPANAATPNASFPFYNGDVASLVNHSEDQDGYYVFELDSSPFAWLGVNLQIDYTDMEAYSYQRNNYNGQGFKSRIDNEVWGYELNAELTPKDNLKLLVGTDYHDHDWKNLTRNLDAGGNETTSTSNKAKIHSKSTYYEVQFRPIKEFKALAGMRHEAHSTFGNINLPHYGFVMTPVENLNVKFNNGKHFKAPTPNDLFWPEDVFTKGNPNLEAQRGWHSDLTVEASLLDNALFVTGSYFEWDIKGKIDWAFDPGIGKWTPTNLNSSVGDGWELAAKYAPSSTWDVSIDYTYTQATDKLQSGERDAQHLANHKAKISGVYRWDFGLTASATARYTGARDYYRSSSLTATDTLPSYVTTDIKLEQVLAENYKVSLSVNNLFDENYDTYVGNFSDSAYLSTFSSVWGNYPGAGLSTFFKVSYIY